MESEDQKDENTTKTIPGSSFESRKNCQPCEGQGKITPAFYWCMTCPDFICDGCRTMHKTLRTTRNHVILEIEEYTKVGIFLTNFDTICQTHPAEISNYFCFTHNTPCCCTCKDKNHQYECNIQHENDIHLREDQGQPLLTAADMTTKSLIEVKKTIAMNEEATSKLHSQRECFAKELTKVREEVNKFLDRFEKDVNEKFEFVFASKLQSLSDERAKAVENQQRFKYRKEMIDKIMQLDISKLQSFLIGKDFHEELVLEGQNTSQRMSNEKSLKVIPMVKVSPDQKTIHFTDGFELINTFGKDIPENDDENGSSTIDEESSVVTEQARDDTTEQVDATCFSETPYEPNLNENEHSDNNQPAQEHIVKEPVTQSGIEYDSSTEGTIKYRFITRFFVERKNKDIDITSIGFMKPGIIVMSEISENRILFYHTNGFKDGEIKLIEEPGELAIVEDHGEVAVGVLKNIFFLNASYKSISNIVKLKDYIKGVAYANTFVFVCLQHRGIVKIDHSGVLIQKFPFIKGELLISVTMDEVLYSVKINFDSDELHSYDFRNNKKVIHTMHAFAHFVGIACDNQGKVYVGTDYSKVVMFDSKSEKCKIVLTDDDGIDGIQSVACSDDGETIVVCAKNGRQIILFEK